MAARFTRLPDGTWGILGPKDMMTGETILVHSKAGGQKMIVGEIVSRGGAFDNTSTARIAGDLSKHKENNMGTMHVECYNMTHEHQTEGRECKADAVCAYEKCAFAGAIVKGQKFTWTREGKSETKPETKTFTASNVEITIGSSRPDEGPPVTPVTLPAPAGSSDALATLLAAAVMPTVQAQITAALGVCNAKKIADEVITEVTERLSKTMAMRVEIKVGEAPTKDVGVQHKAFAQLCKMIASGCNVWVKGPAGSGKTYGVMHAAKAFDMAFYYTGAVGDAYALLGFKDATGTYRRTAFRDAYEHGGLFLWDEVDASDANALLAFNAALENGVAAFPDGLISRHPDFKCVAAGNTVGQGATQEYVGRNRLDVAFLSRFVTLAWDYDDNLELATAPNASWTARVQLLRKRAADKGIRVLITPRASYNGGRLLAAGLSRAETEHATIGALMTPDQYKQISQ